MAYNRVMKNREQWVSLLGVVALAIVLPGILRLANSAVRFMVGAEGRLAAIGVETNGVLGPMSYPWRSLAQGGVEVKTFLNSEEATPVANLLPQYIRIDNIYDQFNVVSRTTDGLAFNWTELDKTVSNITAVGAKPFFSLSYMPQVMATKDEVSVPKDWDDWEEVVQKTIEHYSGEMGMTGVYYEVWNEPDLFGKWTMGGSKDYRILYLHTARGAARAIGVKDYKLGGPATTGLYKAWMDGFFQYVKDNNLRLDFFSWHRYDTNLAKYIEDVQSVDQWLDSYPYFAGVEKVITEMGPSSKAGGTNDTNAGAAHLVAVVRTLMYKIKYGFTFAIDGQFGILHKPRYNAMQLLNQLGDQRLSVSGEGTWVQAIAAKKAGISQVLLVNYDAKESHNELVPVTFLHLSDKNFELRETQLGQDTRVKEVATTEAILQTQVVMRPNSVVLIELEPK